MLLLVRTKSVEGAIIGWCPDKSGVPQAIIATTKGGLTFASIREIQLLNVPRRVLRQALKIQKREAKNRDKTSEAELLFAGEAGPH